jgi:hypothetical protein
MSGVLQHRYAPFGFAALALVTDYVALTTAWTEVPNGKGVQQLTLLDPALTQGDTELTTARLPVLGALGVAALLNALALYNAFKVSFSLEIKRLSEVRKWLMFATAATVLALVVWFVLLGATNSALGIGGGAGNKALGAASVAPTSGAASSAAPSAAATTAGSLGRLLEGKPVKNTGVGGGGGAAGGAAAVGSTALFGLFFQGQIFAGLSAISSGMGMLAARAQLGGA